MVKFVAPLLAGLALFLVPGTACTRGVEEPVTFIDGRFEAIKPASWRMFTDLHDEADLQMGNFFDEAYFTVLSESHDDFDGALTLEDFGNITRGMLLEGLFGANEDGPEELTIQGRPAIRYIITGTIDDLPLTYWHVVLDTGGYFHQVILWSLRSSFDENQADFERALMSLRAAG